MIVLSRMIAGASVALDHAAQHAATGHGADAADLEYLLHQHAAKFDFALFRLEHAFEGQLQVVGDLVDHVVPANLHALLVGHHAGLFVGHHIEADDDRVRCIGQRNVGLA